MRKYVSEFLGTFILVFCGCGSMLAANFLIGAMGMPIPLAFTTITIALAFGLTTSMIYYLLKDVSGAHLNPAVSVAVLMNGGFESKGSFAGYIIAQFAGSAIGACALWLITGQRTYLGQNGYGDQSALYIGIIPAIIVEIIITMIFVLVFLKIRNSEKENTAAKSIILGICTAGLYAMAIPFTGGSLNPARSFGPALLLLGENIKQLPVFIIAPIVGAIIAAILYNVLIEGKAFTLKKSNIEETIEETIEEEK